MIPTVPRPLPAEGERTRQRLSEVNSVFDVKYPFHGSSLGVEDAERKDFSIHYFSFLFLPPPPSLLLSLHFCEVNIYQ